MKWFDERQTNEKEWKKEVASNPTNPHRKRQKRKSTATKQNMFQVASANRIFFGEGGGEKTVSGRARRALRHFRNKKSCLFIEFYNFSFRYYNTEPNGRPRTLTHTFRKWIIFCRFFFKWKEEAGEKKNFNSISALILYFFSLSLNLHLRRRHSRAGSFFCVILLTIVIWF